MGVLVRAVVPRAGPWASVARLLLAVVSAGLGNASSMAFCPGVSLVTPQLRCLEAHTLPRPGTTRAPWTGGTLMLAKRRSDGDGLGSRRAGGRILRVSIDEMFPGMELEGIIRSVKPYGAFVDVGSTTDGLLHISNLLPMHREHIGNDLVVTASEGEKVLVEVVSIDREQGRFALREVELPEYSTAKLPAKGSASAPIKGALSVEEAEEIYGGIVTGDEPEPQQDKRSSQKDSKVRLEKWGKRMEGKGHYRNMREGVVRSVTEYGAFIDVGGPVEGLLHVSEIEGKSAVDKYGKVLLQGGDKVKVRLLALDAEAGKVSLSMRKWEPSDEEANREALEIVKNIKQQEEGESSNSAFAAAWKKAIEKG